MTKSEKIQGVQILLKDGHICGTFSFLESLCEVLSKHLSQTSSSKNSSYEFFTNLLRVVSCVLRNTEKLKVKSWSEGFLKLSSFQRKTKKL